MFTDVTADVPLYLPQKQTPVHADLKLDFEHVRSQPSYIQAKQGGHVTLEFDHAHTADTMLDLLRVNNLLGLTLGWMKIDAPKDAIELSEDEIQLCQKLTDAGLTYEQARDWLIDILKVRSRG